MKVTAHQRFKEAHDGVIILGYICCLGVLLCNLQFFRVPGDGATHGCDFLSFALAFNYVLGAKESFSQLQLVECRLSKQYFCFASPSPLPLNSSHTSSAHGHVEQSGAYESHSSSPHPLSNIFSICSQLERHCLEPEGNKHSSARCIPNKNPFLPILQRGCYDAGGSPSLWSPSLTIRTWSPETCPLDSPQSPQW